jgi:hypothetical protein
MKMNIAHLSIELGNGDSKYARYEGKNQTFEESGLPSTPELIIRVNDFREAELIIQIIEANQRAQAQYDSLPGCGSSGLTLKAS